MLILLGLVSYRNSEDNLERNREEYHRIIFHMVSSILTTRTWKLENGRSELFTSQKMQFGKPSIS